MRIYKTLRSLFSKTGEHQRRRRTTLLTQQQQHQQHPLLQSKWVIFIPRGPLFISSPLLFRTGPKAAPIFQPLNLLKWNHNINHNEGQSSVQEQKQQQQLNSLKEDGFVLRRSYFNFPNFISLARLVSGPFIGWMITNELYAEAFVGLVISGATDWLDGYVARKMRIDSVVGSYLDPLADKVLIGSVALAMVLQNLLHPGLVGLVVLRDVVLVGGAVYHRASSLGWKWSSWYDFVNLDGTRPEKVEPLFISKVNTVLQLVLVAAALLQPEFGTPETESYITYLSWLVAATTVASTAAYGAKYTRNRSLLLAKKS